MCVQFVLNVAAPFHDSLKAGTVPRGTELNGRTCCAAALGEHPHSCLKGWLYGHTQEKCTDTSSMSIQNTLCRFMMSRKFTAECKIQRGVWKLQCDLKYSLGLFKILVWYASALLIHNKLLLKKQEHTHENVCHINFPCLCSSWKGIFTSESPPC